VGISNPQLKAAVLEKPTVPQLFKKFPHFVEPKASLSPS
jgi:hypothetical protein